MVGRPVCRIGISRSTLSLSPSLPSCVCVHVHTRQRVQRGTEHSLSIIDDILFARPPAKRLLEGSLRRRIFLSFSSTFPGENSGLSWYDHSLGTGTWTFSIKFCVLSLSGYAPSACVLCLKSNKICHGTIFNFHDHKNVSMTSRSNLNICRPNVASIYWLLFRKSAFYY